MSLCLEYLVQSSKWRVELGVWEVVFFPVPEEVVYPFLVYFGIVQIWPMYHSLDKKVWITIMFSPLQRESHSVPDMDFLLYLHLFCPI